MNVPFFKISPDLQFQLVKSARAEENSLRYTYYQNRVTNEKFYDDDLPILLTFLDLIKEGNFRLSDFHWCGDFETFNSTNTFIVSGKLKSLIEKLILPPHQFYPAIIRAVSEDYSIEKTGYYVFHFLQDYFQEIDFGQSQFAIRWLGNYNEETYTYEVFCVILDKGAINSIQAYHAKLESIKILGKSPKIFPLN